MPKRGGDKIFKNKQQELEKEAFKREKNTRDKIPDIIIACEDESSAPAYLKMFVDDLIRERKITQDSFVIAKPNHSNPKGVLKDLLQHNKNGKSYKDFECKWIVIDRDIERVNGGGHNPNDFNSALSSAKSKKVEIAYSNDAFELWYLLHFDYRDTAIDRDELNKKVIEELQNLEFHIFAKLDNDNIKSEKYAKLIYLHLLPKLDTAIDNAKKLLAYYGEAHNPESDNPSTTVHELIIILQQIREKSLKN